MYGAATGQVLSVSDTAAALRMAPLALGSAGSLPRAAAALWTAPSAQQLQGPSSGTLLGPCAPGPLSADSPSGCLSAAPSSAATPPLSRASSSSSADALPLPLADAPSVEPPQAALKAAASFSSRRSAPVSSLTLLGRSLTAAPVVQVLVAGELGAGPEGRGAEEGRMPTPTGAAARVAASFALIGLRAGGRVAGVRCCRILPAWAVAEGGGGEAGAAAVRGAVGVVVEVELLCAAAGSLLLFVEAGPHGPGPVARVALEGGAAPAWAYDDDHCLLRVALPPGPSERAVRIFL